mgnify:CR=1 FL=1
MKLQDLVDYYKITDETNYEYNLKYLTNINNKLINNRKFIIIKIEHLERIQRVDLRS